MGRSSKCSLKVLKENLDWRLIIDSNYFLQLPASTLSAAAASSQKPWLDLSSSSFHYLFLFTPTRSLKFLFLQKLSSVFLSRQQAHGEMRKVHPSILPTASFKSNQFYDVTKGINLTFLPGVGSASQRSALFSSPSFPNTCKLQLEPQLLAGGCEQRAK